MWPQVDSITQIGAGNGSTGPFTGYIAGNQNPGSPGAPILRNYVFIDSIDTNGNGLSMIDVPVVGMPNYGNLYAVGTEPAIPSNILLAGNNVNYITGAFEVTFLTAPGVGQPINAQVYNYVPSRPLSLMWFQNQFTLRPVPDQPYQIQIEVYKRPTALISDSQIPELEQWWQYIAYGTARKILQLRYDYPAVNAIEPEFQKQQEMVLRRTVVQNTNQRVPTIYSQQSDIGAGWGNWNGYGQSGV
jgi:hypothetical protein